MEGVVDAPPGRQSQSDSSRGNHFGDLEGTEHLLIELLRRPFSLNVTSI